MTITAAVDGSALGNPGPAGWAWYIDADNWAAGGWEKSTNNRGELTAVAELLDATAHRADEELHVLCDSQYVINSVTKWMKGWKKKGWKKRDGKPVLNVDLMQRIDSALAGRNVRFEWVRGHSGHAMNEIADDKARGVAIALSKGATPDGGPGFAGAPARASRQISPGDAPVVEEAQPGLFDLAEPAGRINANAVLGAHRALARAIGKFADGGTRRARSLTREALIEPSLDAVPEEFADAKPELTAAVGATAVTRAAGDGWAVTCSWSVGDTVRLVCLHAAETR